ncbi:MAG: hypothetical protein LIO68_05930, partial [Rikenellaceae bacterium]|nr:hypothetical protein [Rikenellaceae bacterium]
NIGGGGGGNLPGGGPGVAQRKTEPDFVGVILALSLAAVPKNFPNFAPYGASTGFGFPGSALFQRLTI